MHCTTISVSALSAQTVSVVLQPVKLQIGNGETEEGQQNINSGHITYTHFKLFCPVILFMFFTNTNNII